VGGLVACPVVGVPTSVGYGASFGGIAALLTMLNSCASGVSVVNIDNGFGAGYQASLINKKAPKAPEDSVEEPVRGKRALIGQGLLTFQFLGGGQDQSRRLSGEFNMVGLHWHFPSRSTFKCSIFLEELITQFSKLQNWIKHLHLYLGSETDECS
jgi:hypothetical protein